MQPYQPFAIFELEDGTKIECHNEQQAREVGAEYELDISSVEYRGQSSSSFYRKLSKQERFLQWLANWCDNRSAAINDREWEKHHGRHEPWYSKAWKALSSASSVW